MQEIWKPLIGWEEYYEVSDQGGVRRKANSPGRYKVERPLSQFELKRSDGKPGYMTLRLKAKLKGQKTVYVHRVVCEAFNGPAPSDQHQCCHNDGDKQNNMASNLRWDTRSANEMDRVKHGTSNRGSRHGLSKLVEDDVRRIREQIAQKVSSKSIAEIFNVSPAAIYCIKVGKTWAHLV